MENEPALDTPKHANGEKHDAGKLQYRLLPLRGLRSVTQVLTFGVKKYAPDNWQADARLV